MSQYILRAAGGRALFDVWDAFAVGRVWEEAGGCGEETKEEAAGGRLGPRAYERCGEGLAGWKLMGRMDGELHSDGRELDVKCRITGSRNGDFTSEMSLRLQS